MDILTQEQLLLNAQAQFDALKAKILEYSQAGIRIDQAERNLHIPPKLLHFLRGALGGRCVGRG